jgi:hypothetical protein
LGGKVSTGVIAQNILNMTFKLQTVFVLLLTSLLSFAQENGQILRGTLIDQISHQPIPFANIVLSDSIVASTNDAGIFRFSNLKIGIYTLKASYIGYESLELRNVTIDAGKDAIYNLTMLESAETLDEVVVTATKDKTKPLNEMSLLSTRMVGVEETKNYATAFNDPARMANSFAGVVQTEADNNNIAIRGNAPNGLLWRLEGVEIPNPNHFSSVGTSGGGVSILSGQLLANSDFSTGAFAAEYGNALSGVFDIKLRKGNNEKREYTIQLGVLGIDVAAEGPFTSSGNNSYLVNYRYSTLGILSQTIDLGGFVTTFQDLSYNMSFKNDKWGDFTLFGVNGLSHQTGHDSIFAADLKFEANTLVNGLTHSKTIGKTTFMKNAIVYSNTKNKIVMDEIDNITNENFVSYNEEHSSQRWTISSKIQHKLNPKTSIKMGFVHRLIGYDEYKSKSDGSLSTLEILYNQKGNTSTSQVYGQLLYRANSRLTTTGGVHLMYNWFNDTKSIEPRVAAMYATAPNQFLSLGYGLHSQTLPLGIYFVETQSGSESPLPNRNLSNSKAHHLVLGYNVKVNPFLNIKMETYYQSLFNIPQGLIPSENISLINNSDGTIDQILENKGKGRNYGAELTVEKFLNKGYYFNVTGSAYSAKYKGTDGNWYNSKFNAGYASSITGGKIFTLSKKKKRTMGIHFKSIYTGGLRQSPIDLEQSIIQKETVYDNTVPFIEQNPNYFRVDFKVAFKRNYKKMTTSLIFDIQNIMNRKNYSSDVFNESTQLIEQSTQVGLLPVISYKIEF